ncbi:acyltransferase [Pantoea sp. aB]|uniref:acyltransferase family protein n=1 Tax=Pantoea sp. aB TaxID=517433 RepID=UPI0001E09BA5|nr:acyltransferase [Pantoea sp. aB]EFM18626.1 acyltransferase 3 [Pantoea sp. aB]
MRKNLDIELLRSVGIIFVIVSHLHNLFPWYDKNESRLAVFYDHFGLWTGVDLFFCVSGFIITKTIMDKLPPGHTTKDFFSFAIPFWVRRIYRLWPSAWFWLSFTSIAAFIFNQTGVFGEPFKAILYQVYAMLNIANLYGYECTKIASCGTNQVFWSLSLEEQFYWIFPIALFFIRGNKFIVVMLIIALIQIPLDRGGHFIGFIRTDAISLGVVIGYLSRKDYYSYFEPNNMSKFYFKYTIPLLLILMLALLGTWKTVVVPWSTGVVAIVSAILVWIASYNKGYLFGNGFIKRVTEVIGARSYTLYLTHIPAFYTAIELINRYENLTGNPIGHNHFVYLASAAIIMIIFTELSHRIIEKPCHNYGRRITYKQ